VALLAVAGAWLLTAAPPALAAEYGSLSGKVTDASTQAPIEGIEACAISVNLELLTEEEFEHGFRCAKTAATGEYTITELQDEKYRVGFFIPETGSLNYVGEYYGGKQLESEATEVAVKAGATTPEINGELSPGAEIAGTVTNAATGAPVAEASVCAFAEPVSGGPIELEACAESGAAGSYTLRGLASGQYKLFFLARTFALAFYDGKSTRAEATFVAVTAPNLTTIEAEPLKPVTESTLPMSSIGPPVATSKSALPGASTTPPVTGTLSVLTRHLTVKPDGETTLRLACAGSARCRGKVTLRLVHTVTLRGRRVRRQTVIGTSAVLSFGAGRRLTAEIKLDAKARRLLLADHGRLKVQMTLVTPGHSRLSSIQLIERGRAGS
jgi:hypothetical protein